MSQISHFSLHKISSEDETTFTFSAKDYSRFKFGDDTTARRYGMDLAQAFIETELLEKPLPKFVVTVSCHYIPTAAFWLRHHFVSYLNRYLAFKGSPAEKVDIYRNRMYATDHATQGAGDSTQILENIEWHIDVPRIQGKTIIVIDDIRVTGKHEERKKRMFAEAGLTNTPIHFVYFAEVTNSAVGPTFEHRLNSTVVHTIQDLAPIVRNPSKFRMNCCFVKFILKYAYVDFCRFMRMQEDGFAQILLDYALGSQYYSLSEYEENCRFLRWDVGVREAAERV
ncbi:hypothetical protein CC78DRAFT_534765 [Lojkania enalia]|uniref:Uncharacterized protein n=1 Tax=Lojkania enalia TaxID=147567 RepID=A0A9P4K7I5_9PLEO|nr:hypothetical protein CC78DRAFT_534765 [Didymosphaeria enalia]